MRIGMVELDEVVEPSLIVNCAFGDAQDLVWRGSRRFRPFGDGVARGSFCVGPFLFIDFVYCGILSSSLQPIAERRGRDGGSGAM